MKKKLITGLLLVSIFAVTPCAFARTKKAGAGDGDNVVMQPEQKTEKDAAKEAKKEAKRAAKEAKAAEKKEKTEIKKNSKQKASKSETENPDKKTDKNYVGWINSSKKDVLFKAGKIQIKIKPGYGTFNLAAINEMGKAVPVFSTVDECTTTSLTLKAGKKTYKLFSENKVRTGASRNPNGLNVLYSIPEVADVIIGFDCFASVPQTAPDMLKVTMTVKNTGAKKSNFSLKAIFDTVLGENGRYHFYTSDNLPVKNEICYRTMQNQKWITSKNDNTAMQFIFYGADTTPIELVALANYSTFQKNTWEPNMLSYRAFDNILSYNNSAVGVIWPEAKLSPGESSKNVFYIALATDGEKPAAEQFLAANEKKADSELEDPEKPAKPDRTIKPVPVEEASIKETAPAASEVLEKEEPEPVKPLSVEETRDTEPTPVENSGAAEAKPAEPPVQRTQMFKPSDKQLTPEYIQSLIDRITELENDVDNVDEAELNRLNDELDAILTFLRQ